MLCAVAVCRLAGRRQWGVRGAVYASVGEDLRHIVDDLASASGSGDGVVGWCCVGSVDMSGVRCDWIVGIGVRRRWRRCRLCPGGRGLVGTVTLGVLRQVRRCEINRNAGD